MSKITTNKNYLDFLSCLTTYSCTDVITDINEHMQGEYMFFGEHNFTFLKIVCISFSLKAIS